ncbi:histidine kinase [Acidovorax sp. SRB_14]|uniref:flagellar motor protein MotB n=1 Tax=unclassified Acidovorax TaxID=2684926 RepID=UPI00145DD0CE|nr:histidine kinase [Acidovorax sp. SRB_24]NMM76386.1 histidine kinase [Acidovorax sp. SRB_24]NMM79784.1 histidine kinase [Acidovorax sp. SRB_14]NMM84874.1 histidine kinase [Rhodococcus sp. SRB_17]
MSAAREKQHQAIVKRVSRKHDDEEHGGAWKVAFADFCLALMCLFLLLWVLAARNAEHTEEVLRTTGGKLFDEGAGHKIQSFSTARGSLIPRDPIPAQGDTLQPRKAFTNGTGNAQDTLPGAAPLQTRYESPADLQQLSAILAKLSDDAGLASNLQTIITPYGLRVMLHDTAKLGMFERGSAFPTDRFRRLLRKIGPVFARMENQMLIVGHTDSLPYADGDFGAASNWTLSNSRAMSARYHLLAGGMPATSTLQIVGMADRAPFDANDSTADINRRIELLILTSEHAGNIAAMFGVPGTVTPLLPGVDSALPERNALTAMRETLKKFR